MRAGTQQIHPHTNKWNASFTLTHCLLDSHTIQVKAFAKEWKEYVYTIELQSHQGPNAFGRHLDPAKVALVPFSRSEDEQPFVCVCACVCARELF